jgi:hypothetical protein
MSGDDACVTAAGSTPTALRGAALASRMLGGPLPSALEALLRPTLGTEELEAFEASLVVPIDGAPPRLAVADRGHPSEWERTVRAEWPHPKLDRFLALARGTRRMIDTRGDGRAAIFLDDLQEQSLVERGLPLMCLVLDVPSGDVVRITRHAEPPHELALRAGESAARALETLVARGARGVWGVRWRKGAPTGFVWISESRWKRDFVRTRELVERYDLPDAWRRVSDLATELGLAPYPDAMDFEHGRFDLTVGLVRP